MTPGLAAQARLKVSVHPVVVPETVQSARRCRIRSRLLLALAASAVLLALPGAALGAAPGSAGPAHLVDVFAGTAPGAGTFGGGHNFPGATVPFGMLQWSPDTTPADQKGLGGDDFRDHHLRGFSLTHLSGAGCEIYGDFPFLPTTEPLTASPVAGNGLAGRFQPGFSHRGEEGRPGYYSLRLNPARGGAIRTELSATTRTGIARFTFPGPACERPAQRRRQRPARRPRERHDRPAPQRDRRGRLQRSVLRAAPPLPRLCGGRLQPPVRRLGHLDREQPRTRLPGRARRKRPGRQPAGHRRGGRLRHLRHPPQPGCERPGRALLRQRRRRPRQPRGRRPGLGFGDVAHRAEASWNRSLGRIAVSGQSRRLRSTFYTALYHALLAPRTFSDVGGSYLGMDGAVHRARGRIQYADFSGWDVYRTEIPLLSLLVPAAPGRSSARCSPTPRERLPAALVAGRRPDDDDGRRLRQPRDRLGVRLRGSRLQPRRRPGGDAQGGQRTLSQRQWRILERQGLDQYLTLGYVPFDLDTRTRNANSLYGDPESVWASAATSLEYAVDDFSIAQFAARALADRPTYAEMIRRSGTWRRLFDPATGAIEPRYADGSFPADYSPTGGAGFVEGDAAQYTWAVPQDPAGLFGLLGGRAAAARRLDRFLRTLNGGPGATHSDHALLGNEPNLNVPWLYDWAGELYRTQLATRRALLGLYSPSPTGYPGNDDLGTLSAWYVFGALGLYPEVPGVGILALSGPLFPRAVVKLAGHRRLTITAAGGGPYIHSLRWRGRPREAAWTTYCALARGGTLAYGLGRRPDHARGAAARDLPPSFGPQRPPPAGPCAAAAGPPGA